MNRTTMMIGASMLVVNFFAQRANADLLTFETTPNGASPIDNAALTTAYNVPGGTVRFFFDVNGNNTYDPATDQSPEFEQVGDSDPANGFQSNTGPAVHDTARPGYETQLGSFFLRQPNGVGNVPGPFIAQYATTAVITELSGEIWDIDGAAAAGTEEWRVEVLDHAGNVLASQLSPLGTTAGQNSLDSLPWTFQFTSLPAGVEELRLTFTGTKTDVGLAFNNFSPTTIPEPAALLLAVAGASLILGIGRRLRSGAGGRT